MSGRASSEPTVTRPRAEATTSLSPSVELDAERFDAAVFDMDGEITDTAQIHAAAWKQMFDSYLERWSAGNGADQDPFDRDDYLTYVDGKHRDDGVASFLTSRGIELPRGSDGDGPDLETVWGLANRKNVLFQRELG